VFLYFFISCFLLSQKQVLLDQAAMGDGGSAENLHTPLSPLFRGESKRLKFLNVNLLQPNFSAL